MKSHHGLRHVQGGSWNRAFLSAFYLANCERKSRAIARGN